MADDSRPADHRSDRGFKVRALGEIAIRCNDLQAMSAFYRDIIGLDHLSGGHRDGIVFFRIGESFDGHTAVLALFQQDAARQSVLEESAISPLHHLALSLSYDEQDAVMRWYEQNGIDYQVQIFDWIGWRGIFARDPEGNTVELVAYYAALANAAP